MCNKVCLLQDLRVSDHVISPRNQVQMTDDGLFSNHCDQYQAQEAKQDSQRWT